MTTMYDTLRIVDAGPSAFTALMPVEMMIALDKSYPDERREYAAGYVKGILIGLGFEGSGPLRIAEATFYAQRKDFDTLMRRYKVTFSGWPEDRIADVTHASGLLNGYWDATSDSDQAEECFDCGRRIMTNLDPYRECPDGYSCADGDCGTDLHSECRAEGLAAIA